MTEICYEVVRCESVYDLDEKLEGLARSGWKPVGKLEVFNGVFAQPIQIPVSIDDTEQITVPINR
jgi:hypothetical protein